MTPVIRTEQIGALSACAFVAMLAGCGGGSGTPLSPSPGALTSAAYGVLYSFEGDPDGADPYAGLINVKGTLYGTTLNGGAYGYGTVFTITPSGTETVLHSFGASGDGATPFSSLSEVNGTFYGTTLFGGANSVGSVFSITPSGTETVLYSFKQGSGDGETPEAGLVNLKGVLYGTTSAGGQHLYGTVFSITTSGKEYILHGFGASGDGAYPNGGLTDVNGTLYGTTVYGGTGSCSVFYSGCGTVFSITPSGVETVLYKFSSGSGVEPYAGLLNAKGTLYGTTENGGGNGGAANGEGTVFSITTSGTVTVLHRFPYFPGDGEQPYGDLIKVKGTLFGTTYAGGADRKGTVFQITSSGKEIVLHSFGGSGDGEEPWEGLVDVDGTLYGTTYGGGANGDGTVFWLSP
jgi:uncharacterized repeat protein (TIGR03803 family)